jgi:hypothetical protein
MLSMRNSTIKTINLHEVQGEREKRRKREKMRDRSRGLELGDRDRE